MRSLSRLFAVVLLALVMACSLIAGSATAQETPKTSEGQITFYNGGTGWKIDLPGARKALFFGAIFQEKQKLAEFYRPRFLTLTIRPRDYIFSASLQRSHPAANSQMLLTVLPGKHYFVRVVKENGSFPGPVDQGRLDLVPCEVAQKEAGKMKPLEAKYLDPATANRAVKTATLPGCQ